MPPDHVVTIVNWIGTLLLAVGILGILAVTVMDWLQRRAEEREAYRTAGLESNQPASLHRAEGIAKIG